MDVVRMAADLELDHHDEARINEILDYNRSNTGDPAFAGMAI